MIKKTDHDHDHDHDPANDNGGTGAVAPAPSGGALAALTALGTVLANVDVSGAGGSGLPMLQYKSRENTWLIGQRRIVPDENGHWAFNPQSFQWGYVCFNAANKRLGERLVPISLPMPNPAELPNHEGGTWTEEWAVNAKCVTRPGDGPDAGVEVIFKSTTVGGIGCVKGLISEVRDRVLSGQFGDKVVPVALLKKDSYPHSEHGRIWFPVIETIDWLPLSGPTTAPTPTPTPGNDEEPRRRRVA